MSRPPLVYKITTCDAWAAAEAASTVSDRVLAPSADDVRDGFVHLSTAAQVAATAARHFAGRPGLCLVAFDAARLGAALRYEPSRGGDLFPHLYGPLRVADALWTRPLPLDTAGVPDVAAVLAELADGAADASTAASAATLAPRP